MKSKILVLSFLLTMAHICHASDFIWFSKTSPVTYVLPKTVAPVVYTAVTMWRQDLAQVTGQLPTLLAGNKNRDKARIRFIQYDQDQSNALKSQGVPVDKLAKTKEAFYIKVAGKQLQVIGSDPRGLAYGILELSRLAGVSPWVWWGEVTPDKKTTLTLPDDFETFQSPSVEYRGIFINDEDWSLQPWSWLNFDPHHKKGMISAKTYKKVFQLMLRLRANMIWPAMHGSSVPFYWTPGAKQVADSCGIVIGTSHCEPMMSNANGEWNENNQGPYNYITNRDSVIAYWSRRLKAVAPYDNIYTLGLRGKHDGSMEGVHTLSEKTKALQAVINDQRSLLKKYVNPDLQSIPQQFVPYKEVLDIYENGLQVPQDVMLTWCDDNYGYLTRLSDKKQQTRTGGSGVYYHLSYWGRPHDYLWLTTTQPGLIYYEMSTAYHHNAKRLWIVNVHDPKVAAFDLELFLDLAWDIHLTASRGSVATHLKNCLIRDYGHQVGEQLYPVMKEFYHLTAIRKPEFMGWEQVELDKKTYPRGISPAGTTEFSFTQFAGEADRYLAAYAKIKTAVEQIEKEIPAGKKDAYFAAIKYPVCAAADMATKWLEAARAKSLASGDYSAVKRSKAKNQLMTASAKSLKAYQEIRSMTDYYNNKLNGGQWKYLMCFNPRNLPVFDQPSLPIDLTEQEINLYTAKANDQEAPYDSIQPDPSYVALNAADYTKASFTPQPVEMLGHSMEAVPLPKQQSLTYVFNTTKAGAAVLRTAVIPTQPNDKGDIRYSVQIDDNPPQVISFRQKGRTETWKTNVLRGQAVNITPCQLNQGQHQLKITALDDHIIIDQWMVDFKANRKFYVFPINTH
ncbi:glycosyl hydrolase 115 family protein [Arachidicoccus ginsenosidivorans]